MIEYVSANNNTFENNSKCTYILIWVKSTFQKYIHTTNIELFIILKRGWSSRWEQTNKWNNSKIWLLKCILSQKKETQSVLVQLQFLVLVCIWCAIAAPYLVSFWFFSFTLCDFLIRYEIYLQFTREFTCYSSCKWLRKITFVSFHS